MSPHSRRCGGFISLSESRNTPAGARLFADTAEKQRPRVVDATFGLVIRVAGQPLDAQLGARLSAFTVRHVSRGARVGEDLPDIVAVVDEERLAVAHPPGVSIRRGRIGRVIVFVVERDVQRAGDGARRPRVGVEQMPLLVLVEERELAVG